MYALLGAKALQMLSSTTLGVKASQIQHTCTGSEETLAECQRSWLRSPISENCKSFALLSCASEWRLLCLVLEAIKFQLRLKVAWIDTICIVVLISQALLTHPKMLMSRPSHRQQLKCHGCSNQIPVLTRSSSLVTAPLTTPSPSVVRCSQRGSHSLMEYTQPPSVD